MRTSRAEFQKALDVVERENIYRSLINGHYDCRCSLCGLTCILVNTFKGEIMEGGEIKAVAWGNGRWGMIQPWASDINKPGDLVCEECLPINKEHSGPSMAMILAGYIKDRQLFELFPTSGQWDAWQARNCQNCLKQGKRDKKGENPKYLWNCELERSLFESFSISDTFLVYKKTAQEIGWFQARKEPFFLDLWDCAKIERRTKGA